MVKDDKNCRIADPVKKIEETFSENQWEAEEELGNLHFLPGSEKDVKITIFGEQSLLAFGYLTVSTELPYSKHMEQLQPTGLICWQTLTS